MLDTGPSTPTVRRRRVRDPLPIAPTSASGARRVSRSWGHPHDGRKGLPGGTSARTRRNLRGDRSRRRRVENREDANGDSSRSCVAKPSREAGKFRLELPLDSLVHSYAFRSPVKRTKSPRIYRVLIQARDLNQSRRFYEALLSSRGRPVSRRSNLLRLRSRLAGDSGLLLGKGRSSLASHGGVVLFHQRLGRDPPSGTQVRLLISGPASRRSVQPPGRDRRPPVGRTLILRR